MIEIESPSEVVIPLDHLSFLPVDRCDAEESEQLLDCFDPMATVVVDVGLHYNLLQYVLEDCHPCQIYQVDRDVTIQPFEIFLLDKKEWMLQHEQ
mmetsp:Transcript_31451/g.48151  ORF Transcript_31451/g.48151 Transcript_31451/m.48151 type:complete len:95 (+) Transcript_31451:452-736(+)